MSQRVWRRTFGETLNFIWNLNSISTHIKANNSQITCSLSCMLELMINRVQSKLYVRTYGITTKRAKIFSWLFRFNYDLFDKKLITMWHLFFMFASCSWPAWERGPPLWGSGAPAHPDWGSSAARTVRHIRKNGVLVRNTQGTEE